MIQPVIEPLRAYRWQPFVEQIEIDGLDLSAATLTLQVRAYPDAPGAPLIDLGIAAPTAQGLSVTVATVAGVPVSTIKILINETTLETLLPFPANGAEPGADVVLAYDLVIAAAGLSKARWLSGAFIITPGANQA